MTGLAKFCALYNWTIFLALPCNEASHSSNVAIIVTKHGGHIGFLEGIFPRGRGYADRVFSQYITSVFENGDELRDVMRSKTDQTN